MYAHVYTAGKRLGLQLVTPFTSIHTNTHTIFLSCTHTIDGAATGAERLQLLDSSFSLFLSLSHTHANKLRRRRGNRQQKNLRLPSHPLTNKETHHGCVDDRVSWGRLLNRFKRLHTHTHALTRTIDGRQLNGKGLLLWCSLHTPTHTHTRTHARTHAHTHVHTHTHM